MADTQRSGHDPVFRVFVGNQLLGQPEEVFPPRIGDLLLFPELIGQGVQLLQQQRVFPRNPHRLISDRRAPGNSLLKASPFVFFGKVSSQLVAEMAQLSQELIKRPMGSVNCFQYGPPQQAVLGT
jgi:hypothetical protein